MTDATDDLGRKLRQALQQCNGFEGDESATNRKDASDYYFQRPLKEDAELVGRSNVISGDLSAMVEATLAQMMSSFRSDRVCDFDPDGEEDENQAQLESEAVQYFVMGRENGFLQLTMAIKEILLYRNGQIRINAEDRIERRVKRLSNVEPPAYAELRAQDGVVEDIYDAETKELTLTIERETREFVMESLPGENFLYHSEWHKPDLEGIPICAVRHVGTRASLRSMGISKDKVDQLRPYRQSINTEQLARNPQGEQKNYVPLDNSQELIEWYEIYARLEAREGVDELRRIILDYATATILENKPAPFLNVAAGVAIINPHRFKGISLFDKLKQNQDVRTQLRRALLDNINATNKNRTAGLDGVVNQDDISDGRVNNHVRVKQTVPDVRQALMPLVVPDTSANILANLESTAKERSEMGGAALDLQSAQMQIGGDRMGSEGLDRAYSVAEELTGAMMQTVAATLIRSVFLLAHRTLREYFDGELPIKRNGKWTYIKPSEWPERHNVTVKPGMSPGERTRKINAMNEVLNGQLLMADRGLDDVLVDVERFHKALMDRDRLAEVQNPEQYYVDPASDQGKAAIQNKAKRAEQDRMDKAALMQQSFGLEQLRQAFEKYAHDSDLQFKYFAEVLSAEKTEAEAAGKAALELVKGRGNGADDGRTDSGTSEGGEPAEAE
jgi:hypothetical protein